MVAILKTKDKRQVLAISMKFWDEKLLFKFKVDGVHVSGSTLELLYISKWVSYSWGCVYNIY